MIQLFILLLCAILTACVPVGIKQVGYEVRNPAATQLLSYRPSVLGSGQLPTYALMGFQVPLPTYQPQQVAAGVLNALQIVVSLASVEAAVPSIAEVAGGWTPFVPFLFKFSQFRQNSRYTDDRRTGPMPALLPLQQQTRGAPFAAVGPKEFQCLFDAGTDSTGRSLIGRMHNVHAAATAPYSSCNYASGQYIEMWIPQRFLTPLPDWPDVRITMTLTLTDRTWDVQARSGTLSLSVNAAVPYTTTAPEVQLSSLIFHKFVPSSTIHGVQLTSIRVSFTPGVNILAGGIVALMVEAPIFQNIPVAVGLTLAPIVIGYGNCAAEPTSPHCCFASHGYTRVSNGLFGYDSSTSDSRELHTGGWSVMSIVLGPAGCSLPADKHVTFIIPQTYLGSNPSLINPDGPMSYSYAFRVVNVRIATSTEPEPRQLARYTSPAGPFYTASRDSYNDISSKGNQKSHAFGPYRYGTEPVNVYIIGTSTVNSFTVLVDSLTADVTPSFIRFSFTLSTDWTFDGLRGTPPNLPFTPHRITISSNQGVFKPNQGTIELQLQIANGGFLPAACSAAAYHTNSYATLSITPNPLWDTRCVSNMNAGAVISFTLPGTILLPNPAAGTIVTFDIRAVPVYTVPDFVDSDINTDGVTQANTVDGAMLMDQFGYQTVAVCGVQPYTSGRLTDLAVMTAKDRCVLVAALSVLSPISAGILQCSTGAGLVTFVKYPEAMWSQVHWPLTNLASLGNWAQVVSATPTTPLTYITSYGYMISYPMFAVIVSYPPTLQSLQSLGVNPAVPATWTIAFILRMDRMTLSCQIANDNNPWSFEVRTTQNVVEVLLFVDHLVLGAAGTPLLQVPGSAWGYSNGIVFVTAAHGGVVVGFATVLVSPVPNTDDSDDALFGLLALIAVPILLLCCLAALLWFLRPKAEPCPGCPEYPVQEMYWVNAQPAAPVYMVEPAAQAMMSAPPTTPIYLVQ